MQFKLFPIQMLLSTLMNPIQPKMKTGSFVLIGATTRFVMLMVVFTDRKGTTMIISARHADSQERKLYAKRLREKNS